MPDRWQTYPFEFKGGLITNLSPFQQGVQAPGSARILRNFEPSIFGGYRRVEGYTKFDSIAVPNTGVIRGIQRYASDVYACRGDDLFVSDGTSFTADVNGATSSSTTVVLDNKTDTIIVGQTVTGTGISGTVTVASISAQTSSTATIVLSSAQSLADNTQLTFSGWGQITDNTAFSSSGVNIGTGTSKVRFVKYNFDGTDKLIIVDNAGKPFRFDGTTFEQLSSLPSDTSGSSFVVNFKNHIFLGNGTKVVFSAPYEDDDFSAANGGGIIDVTDTITGLIVFREQLVIFTERTISVIRGSSSADFQLFPVSRDLGCVAEDTVQEIGGDIIFLSSDGLRLFSATEKIGDFNLGSISKTIQVEMLDLIDSSIGGFTSVLIREKNQYRLLGYNASYSNSAAKAIAATQLEQGIAWNDLRGFNAYVAFSEYDGFVERIYFAANDGYVYIMESGNTLDGTDIPATFATPFVPVNDPNLRKTIFKATTFLDVEGSFDLEFSLKFDFDQPNSVQPDSVISSDSASTVTYGDGIYGVGSYGVKRKAIYDIQTIGSGFTVSLLYETTGENTDAVFTIDAATLEFTTSGRR